MIDINKNLVDRETGEIHTALTPNPEHIGFTDEKLIDELAFLIGGHPDFLGHFFLPALLPSIADGWSASTPYDYI